MPGPGGNQPAKGKKNKNWSPSPTGRYTSGYGPMVPAPGTNPGAGVYVHKNKVSDAIRGWGSHNSKTRYGS